MLRLQVRGVIGKTCRHWDPRANAWHHDDDPVSIKRRLVNYYVRSRDYLTTRTIKRQIVCISSYRSLCVYSAIAGFETFSLMLLGVRSTRDLFDISCFPIEDQESSVFVDVHKRHCISIVVFLDQDRRLGTPQNAQIRGLGNRKEPRQ